MYRIQFRNQIQERKLSFKTASFVSRDTTQLPKTVTMYATDHKLVETVGAVSVLGGENCWSHAAVVGQVREDDSHGNQLSWISRRHFRDANLKDIFM
jgi:hypothetical protein